MNKSIDSMFWELSIKQLQSIHIVAHRRENNEKKSESIDCITIRLKSI